MNPIEQLADLIGHARAGIAFTGAGISTESGIPDFRSPGGVWSKQSPVYYDDFLRSRSERIRYWKMRQEMYHDFADAKPNEGHDAIAQLETSGHITAVITQNIDGLHQDGGSRRVIELHGTTRAVVCVGCSKEWPPAKIIAQVEAGDEAPECDECGGPLKSKTISFGQAMPEEAMREAHQLATEADLCLAIGSSLVVEPAASIPRVAKHAGAALVILNKTETPLDTIADLVIHEPIGVTMRSVLEQLGQAS
jgi:NAD-dependent deacetylase